MRLAVISVTKNGALLATRLAQKLTGKVDVFAKTGRNPAGAEEYEDLGKLVSILFHQYDGLVFIMATGIAVRVIAPHIRDKRFDPAIVVMDEGGQNAISLLSGHIGGANELAQTVGEAVGARPVITTATDAMNVPAPDVFAVKLDLAVEPFEQLKHINSSIVHGERVLFFIDPGLANKNRYVKSAAAMGICLHDMSRLVDVSSYDAAVVITDKDLYMVKPHIFLRPATLAVGLGCRKGATSSEIFSALTDACKKVGRSLKSVAVIGTADVKQDEIGILAAVQQLEVPLEIYSKEELQDCIDKFGLNSSEFVKEQIGVGNVCEAAALLGGQADKLILPKTAYQNVTIALAEVKSPSWE